MTIESAVGHIDHEDVLAVTPYVTNNQNTRIKKPAMNNERYQ